MLILDPIKTKPGRNQDEIGDEIGGKIGDEIGDEVGDEIGTKPLRKTQFFWLVKKGCCIFNNSSVYLEH